MLKNKIWVGIILSIILLVFNINGYAFYSYTEQSGTDYFVSTEDHADALENQNEIRMILDAFGQLLGHSKYNTTYPADGDTSPGTLTVIDDLENVTNALDSPCIVTGGEITEGTNAGTFKVNAITEAYLRTSASATAPLVSVTLDEQDNQSIPATDTTYYVVLTYGTPCTISLSETPPNGYNAIPIGKVMKDSSDKVHYLSGGFRFGDGVKKLHQRARTLRAIELESGNNIVYSGTNNFTLTEGIVYAGINRITQNAYDSSTTEFTYIYRDGTGGWTKTQSNTIDYAHYDDGDGTLGNIAPNKYGCHWVYRDVSDGHVYVVYGRGSYTLAEAETAPEPTRPGYLTDFGCLIGKIIAPQAGGSFTEVQMVTDTFFVGTNTSNHNHLGGLQGGAVNEYYHLTADEYANIAYVTDKLSAFAPTTSAELAGVISDETGSGKLVFGTSPTFTTDITTPKVKGDATGLYLQDDGGNGIFIKDGGNVGIGTTSPVSELHVVGNVKFERSAPLNIFRESDQTLPAGLWRLGISSDAFLIDQNTASAGDFSTYSRYLIIEENGNVGIGTTSPGYTLDVNGDIHCTGKLTSDGGNDPPYVLYDYQTRETIIEMIKKEVPPSKLNGAVIFFNGEAQSLELFLPLKGEFRSLDGKLLEKVDPITKTFEVERKYYFDEEDGEVKSYEVKKETKRYKLKPGVTLDPVTGKFKKTVKQGYDYNDNMIEEKTEEIEITKEEAIQKIKEQEEAMK